MMDTRDYEVAFTTEDVAHALMKRMRNEGSQLSRLEVSISRKTSESSGIVSFEQASPDGSGRESVAAALPALSKDSLITAAKS